MEYYIRIVFKNFAFFLVVIISLLSSKSYAQLVVTTAQPAATLASTLAGPGATILAPTLTCPGVANGTFTVSGTLLSMTSGIVLTNGHSAACAGTEPALTSFNDGTAGDPTFVTLGLLPAGTNTFDACILEFNIVAVGDTLSFNYQFGSDEYRTAVCSGYNDAFGFFISGPGIVGTPNMALVPGTNLPVEINTVNNGVPGSSGGVLSNCTSVGAGSPFTSYYLDNTGGTLLSYRGYTQKFRAFHAVTPCDTYHLKLAIVDAGNAIYDSGVFLEGGSLHTGALHFNHADSIGSTINGIPHTIVKGCNSATLAIVSTPALPTNQTIHITYGGTGVHGTDYTAPDSVTLPATDTTISFTVSGIPTPPAGTKTVTLYLSSICGVHMDSVTITILDTPSAHILTPDTSVCGASVLIRTTGTTGLTYLWTPATSLSSATVPQPTATPTATTTYTMTATLPGSSCPPIVRTVNIAVGSIGISMLTPDTTICIGNSVNIMVNGSPTFTYNWTPPTGLNSTTVQNPIATPSVTTTYTVTATLPGSGCGTSVQHITINVVSISDSILTQDTTICAGTSFTIRTTGTPGLTYNWSPSTGLSSPTVAQPVASPVVTTTYVLTATILGCPILTRSIYVSIENTSISMVTPDTTLCQGGVPVNLVVTGSPTYNYSWSPSSGLSSPVVQDPTATVSVTTTYTVTATLPGSICPSTAVVTISVLNIAPISMATTNKIICIGDSVQIQVNGSSGLSYNWLPSTGLSDPTAQNPFAAPTTSTTYTVTASGPGGACASDASITIAVGSVNATMATQDTGICVG